METEKFEEVIGKEIKVVVKTNNWYYKGKLISYDEDWIKIRDFNEKITYIKIENIEIFEVLE